MAQDTVTGRPPSPPQSTDGNYNTGNDNRAYLSANKSHLFTPPMPASSSMAGMASQHGFDPYGDPSHYHTAPEPIYYTPQRTLITSMPPHSSPAMAEHAIHTRSGRALGTPSSPGANTESSRASQSPMPRSKRLAKKKPYRKGGPVINQPLSVLTKDYKTPVRDMSVWVNRPIEERMAAVERRKGKVSRPMNSFMLYRSAYADRVKQFCKENNHQVVSQVAGQSWPLEPPEIREHYERLALLERDNHQAAHPGYKFTPNKTAKRARDDDNSDSDPEWEGSTRSSKRSRSVRRLESRSASSTPFEERPVRYHHAMPALNLSGYEINNPYQHQPQLVVAPNGMVGEYYAASGTLVPYGEQLNDIKYERVDEYPPYQSSMGLLGMPHGGHHELLTSHPAPHPIATGLSVQSDILDPRLGQADADFHFGYYDGDLGLSHEIPRSVTYESVAQLQGGYQQEAYHPGLATLTAEHDVWADPGHAGSDFDSEFQNLQ